MAWIIGIVPDNFWEDDPTKIFTEADAKGFIDRSHKVFVGIGARKQAKVFKTYLEAANVNARLPWEPKTLCLEVQDEI